MGLTDRTAVASGMSAVLGFALLALAMAGCEFGANVPSEEVTFQRLAEMETATSRFVVATLGEEAVQEWTLVPDLAGRCKLFSSGLFAESAMTLDAEYGTHDVFELLEAAAREMGEAVDRHEPIPVVDRLRTDILLDGGDHPMEMYLKGGTLTLSVRAGCYEPDS